MYETSAWRLKEIRKVLTFSRSPIESDGEGWPQCGKGNRKIPHRPCCRDVVSSIIQLWPIGLSPIYWKRSWRDDFSSVGTHGAVIGEPRIEARFWTPGTWGVLTSGSVGPVGKWRLPRDEVLYQVQPLVLGHYKQGP